MTFEFLRCGDCQKRLSEIGVIAGFSEENLSTLMQPERALTAHIPLKRDDGTLDILPAIRVQYSRILGPTKGGIRFHPSVDSYEVTELSFLMTLKNSLAGLPYGGAKGGVAVDAKTLSAGELERVARGYVRAFADILGSDKDIPAPDVGTNEQVMAWMVEELEKITGKKDLAAFTGKPISLGGSLGRETSTSRGGYFILKEMFNSQMTSEIKVAIQGFGNVGSHLAELLSADGFKIVSVSDSSAGVYREDGLNVGKLVEFKNRGGRFADLPAQGGWEGGGKIIDSEDVLFVDADVLAPSALGGVIIRENVSKIKAKTIIEMANGPIEEPAEESLAEKGVVIVPDILANSGGVIVSYFEWEQNRREEVWEEEKVNQRLKEMILEAFEKVRGVSNEKRVTLREASYIVALERLVA
jgi:glutamate dehydrogenase (NADP+)